jgi:hypothetical protein
MDESWIKEHSVFFNGRSHILMEYPASSVVDMVNCLRCMSMNIAKLKVDRLMPRYLDKPFWSMIRHFFPNECSPFSILNKEQMLLLKDYWFRSFGANPISPINPLSLRLIFRASTDGWDLNTYIKKCGVGRDPCVTVIKTVDGYVFGGFDHRSRSLTTQSSGSFLFSLVNPQGNVPVCMHSNTVGTIFSPDRSLSWICGPVFGRWYPNNSCVSNDTFCFKSVPSNEACPPARDQTEPINDGVNVATGIEGIRQWQSNVNLGDITLLEECDLWKESSNSVATVGVDLYLKEDGKGYASIEHAYKVPEGLSKDFMTGSAEFEIADFEVYYGIPLSTNSSAVMFKYYTA